MAFTKSSLLCMALALTFCSTIHALDITKVLGQYSEFSQFSKALTETKLADQINSRNAVTVLALDDAAMAKLSGKSQDAVKAILSTHVLTNYYDERKLMEAQGSHEQVETLFQSSGAAKEKEGYIYVALINEGEVAFGSAAAAPGAPFDVLLVRTVETQPDTVSLLQVNNPIVAPGVEASSLLQVANPIAGSGLEASAVVVPGTTFDGIAQSPSALAPGPSSDSSRVFIGFFGAVSALVSLLMLA